MSASSRTAKMRRITTPISREEARLLEPGEMVLLSGEILAGRDAVLPKLTIDAKESASINGVQLEGTVVFHTAVSPAGVGPTSSNKLEIEESMLPLSELGVRLHLGKGKISEKTVQGLATFGSVYAVVPPVTALLGGRTEQFRVLAYPELGMEALHVLTVHEYPCIIAAVNGRSIY